MPTAISTTTEIAVYTAAPTSRPATGTTLPLAASPVAAGFPSPADDIAERSLDLNDFLIKHYAATFFVRAIGTSMLNAGIFPGDLLVVDRAVEPYDGAVIVAVLDGEFTVKRLRKTTSGVRLAAENATFTDIPVGEHQSFDVWGVVTWVLHSTNNN